MELLFWSIVGGAVGAALMDVAPEGTRPLISAAITHACYGLGIGLVFTMTAAGHG